MRRRWREWSAAGSGANGSGAPALAAAAGEPSYQVGSHSDCNQGRQRDPKTSRRSWAEFGVRCMETLKGGGGLIQGMHSDLWGVARGGGGVRWGGEPPPQSSTRSSSCQG